VTNQEHTMTITSEAQAPTEPSPEAGLVRRLRLPRRGRPRLATLLLSTALVASLSLAGWLFHQKQEADALVSARQEATAQARTAAVALTSYDHTTLRKDFGAVRALATDPFASQFAKASARLTEVLEKYQGTAQGKVIRAAASTGDANRVEVLLFVDQTVTSSLQERPRVDRNRIAMTMVRTPDGWRVSEAELL
jgi:Mce-associated membrane protein